MEREPSTHRAGPVRRRGLLAAVLVPLLLAGCAKAPPPTIVLVVVDTLRRDALSVYGASTPTPHIDALADGGVAHEGLISSFHQTSMSMAALFTGLTPSLETGRDDRAVGWNGRTWCGLVRFARPTGEPGCIPESIATLGEVLQGAGYWTAGVVTNQLLFRPAGFERGFDAWVELAVPKAPPGPGGRPRVRRGGVPATAVNRAVAQILETRPDAPLFLYAHYMDVHDHMLSGVPYTEMVERVDRAVGRLAELLEREGLMRDAAIVFTADHGETLLERHWAGSGPGHRGNPTPDEQIRVPLIVRPARLAPGPGMLRSQDLHALVAGIAGAQVAQASAPALAPGEVYLSELNWQTYRQDGFKSHRRRGERTIQLIDLERDPQELRDVAAEHPDVVARHRARLDALAAGLGARAAAPEALSELSAEDEQALRQLGYIE